MKARITVSISEEDTLEIFMNEAGRDLLVKELQLLNRSWDHFHLGPEGFDVDVELRSIPYTSGSKVYDWGKVLLRPDDWDQTHYPHVMISSPAVE
jgi:hypothetical protein